MAAPRNGGGLRQLPLLLIGLLLTGCGSSGGGGYGGGHYLAGHPSYVVGKPYEINGVWYYPKVDYHYDKTGVASWYGPGFDHRYTANGEVYDMNALTAAHPTLPLPSVVEVTDLDNGRALRLRVNDRGPFADGRLIDVSRRAAQLLGFERSGTAHVRVQILKQPSIEVAQAAMHNSYGPYSPATMLAEAPQAAPLAISAPHTEPPPAPPPAAPILTAPVPAAPALANRTPALPPVAVTPAAATPSPLPAAPPPRYAEASPSQAFRPAAPAPHPAASRFAGLSALSLIGTAHAAEIVPPARSASARLKVALRRPTGHIFIQAGAFAIAAHAQRVRSRIAALGSVSITAAPVRGVPLYRVRLGPVTTMQQADRLLIQVIGSGYPAARIVVD